jgi:TPR repeat protein
MLRSLVICLLLSLSVAHAAPDAKEMARREKIAEQLTQAFSASKAFEAEFQTISPLRKTPVLIRMIFDPVGGLCLIAVNSEKEKVDVNVAFDYADLSKTINYVWVDQAGWKTSLDIPSLALRLYRSGVFAQQLRWDERDLENKQKSEGLGAPVFTLSLDRQKIHVATGWSTSRENVGAGWLLPSEFARASEVVLKEGVVELKFPNGRLRQIDRRTGLLKLESLPHRVSGKPRVIQWVKTKPLAASIPLAKRLPKMAQVKFKPMGILSAMLPLRDLFQKATAQELLKLGNEPPTTDRDKKAYAALVLRQSRLAIRPYAESDVTRVEAERFMQKIVAPAFKADHAKAPETKVDRYVSDLLKRTESETAAIDSEIGAWFLESFMWGHLRLKATLPVDVRQMVDAHEVLGRDAFKAGCHLEFQRAALRKIQKFDLSPSRREADQKRLEAAATLESDKAIAFAFKLYLDGAEAGHAKSMHRVGELLTQGKGADKDIERASKWFRKAADFGYLLSVRQLARQSASRSSGGPDLNELHHWIQRAAELGDVQSMVEVGLIYERGYGGSPNPVEAVAWYRRAAELKDTDGMTNLGVMYRNGHGVKRDPAIAARWYAKAADLGGVRAMTGLAGLYERGIGLPQNYGAALRWYRKAAETGDAKSIFSVGVMLQHGRGAKVDLAEAQALYRKAAEMGLTDAMNNLGALYAKGIGVQADDGVAVKWYRKAADLGDGTAAYILATRYTQGRGVKADKVEAAKWFRKAASTSGLKIVLSVASIFSQGEHVKQDHAEALKWYLKAANAGHATSMRTVAYFYSEGLGTKKDPALFKKWSNLADRVEAMEKRPKRP